MTDDAAMIATTPPDYPRWLTDPAGPLGPDATVVDGQLLRHWGLSEVWRVQLDGPAPRSAIVKRGTGEMTAEVRCYRELVAPLGISAPAVLTARRASAGVAALRPDLAGALDGPACALAERLGRSAGEPVTIVHGDFHAKNLIHAYGGRMVAVDWPGAYLHAHLGDLYCLIREVNNRGLAVDAAALPGVFARGAGIEPGRVPDLLITGGLCWTLLALRWVVEECVHAAPDSRTWIDELVADCRALAG
jgi:hypothetical protein